MFVKGHKKFGGWTSESKEKRKKVHEIFDEVFEEVGGKDRLVQWVNASDDNYRDFIKIMAKRIPQAVEVSDSEDNTTPININVHPDLLKV
ncbi:hypothetical protein AGMMS50233_10270 [Endomicrobiia bacterium]|nr:hypothetical protein AGMMS50233_10270 [Endomicrobiia bacterium]